MTKKAKDKATLYVEIPAGVKKAMERLAEADRRSLAGEVTVALERFIAQEAARPREGNGGG